MSLLAAALVVPLLAVSGPVEIRPIPPRLVCGDALRPAARAATDEADRYSRLVDVRAKRRDGHVWWHRRFFATTHWRRFLLPSGAGGHCRKTTIVYRGLGWRRTYPVVFRPEAEVVPRPTGGTKPPARPGASTGAPAGPAYFSRTSFSASSIDRTTR